MKIVIVASEEKDGGGTLSKVEIIGDKPSPSLAMTIINHLLRKYLVLNKVEV